MGIQRFEKSLCPISRCHPDVHQETDQRQDLWNCILIEHHKAEGRNTLVPRYKNKTVLINLKERSHLQDLGVNERIILKCILHCYVPKVRLLQKWLQSNPLTFRSKYENPYTFLTQSVSGCQNKKYHLQLLWHPFHLLCLSRYFKFRTEHGFPFGSYKKCESSLIKNNEQRNPHALLLKHGSDRRSVRLIENCNEYHANTK